MIACMYYLLTLVPLTYSLNSRYWQAGSLPVLRTWEAPDLCDLCDILPKMHKLN